MIDGRTVGKHNGRVERPNLNTPDFADAIIEKVDALRRANPTWYTDKVETELSREMLAMQVQMLLEEGYGRSGRD